MDSELLSMFELSRPVQQDEFERRVQSSLNSLTSDNVGTVIDDLASLEVRSAEELEAIGRVIFAEALMDPYYSETYADLVIGLRYCYPEFPSESKGEKPLTFIRSYLNTCQNEFESLLLSLAETDSLLFHTRKRKTLNNLKIIGQLFLRWQSDRVGDSSLIAVKVIGNITSELVDLKGLPTEHMIECACELMQEIGHTMDSTKTGEGMMDKFVKRLQVLQATTNSDGTRFYPKRTQFMVQGFLQLRSNGWVKGLRPEAEARLNCRLGSKKSSPDVADLSKRLLVSEAKVVTLQAGKGQAEQRAEELRSKLARSEEANKKLEEQNELLRKLLRNNLYANQA